MLRLLVSLMLISASCRSGTLATMVDLLMSAETVREYGVVLPAMTTRLAEGTHVFRAINFTCDGNITAWTAAGRCHTKPNRMSHPELQICNEEMDCSTSNNNVLPPIQHDGDNNNCVYRYQLAPPLPFRNGSNIAIVQPKHSRSRLEVFHNREEDVRERRMPHPSNSLTGVPLIHIETNVGQECIQGHLMKGVISSVPHLESTASNKKQNKLRIISGLTVPFNGSISTMIVAGTLRNGHGRNIYPKLQVWRPVSDRSVNFILVSSDQIDPDTQPMDNQHVFELSFSPPRGFKQGDMIGVFQPSMQTSALNIAILKQTLNYTSYVREGDTAPHHTGDDIVLESSSTEQEIPVISLRLLSDEDRDDVAVADTPTISEATLSTRNLIQPVTFTTSLISTKYNSPSVVINSTTSFPSLILTSYPLPLTQISHSSVPSTSSPSNSAESSSPLHFTPTPVPTSSTAESDDTIQVLSSSPLHFTPSTAESGENIQTALLASVIVVVVALCILVGVMIVVFGLCVKQYRRKSTTAVTREVDFAGHTVNHTLYKVNSSPNRTHTISSDEEHQYAVVETETPFHTDRYDSHYPDRGAGGNQDGPVDHGYLEVSSQVSVRYQRALYVPTLEQRENVASSTEHTYAVLEKSQSLPADDEQEPDYFSESSIYWEPARDTKEIYAQLSLRRYREIPRQEIRITSHLGSGQFGTVNRAVWYRPRDRRRGGSGDGDGEEGSAVQEMDVAVKMLQPQATAEDSVRFLQEVAISGQFRHPNVVQLFGVVSVRNPLMMVLELLANGDLSSHLLQYRPSSRSQQPPAVDLPRLLCQFCLNVAMGMEYLSRKRFVHRDLAARNVLVAENRVCKIGDFGLSRELETDAYYISHGGQIAIKWTAPEALNFKKYSTASDVWSFGCLMYEIWGLGHKPFEGYSNAETMRVVDAGCRLTPPPGTPRDLYQLMMVCWHPEHSCRPSFSQLTESLSQPDHTLLTLARTSCKLPDTPLATVLGSDLEAGRDLYSDLQNLYL